MFCLHSQFTWDITKARCWSLQGIETCSLSAQGTCLAHRRKGHKEGHYWSEDSSDDCPVQELNLPHPRKIGVSEFSGHPFLTPVRIWHILFDSFAFIFFIIFSLFTSFYHYFDFIFYLQRIFVLFLFLLFNFLNTILIFAQSFYLKFSILFFYFISFFSIVPFPSF